MTVKNESISISMVLSGAGVLLLVVLTALIGLAWDSVTGNDAIHSQKIDTLITKTDSLRIEISNQRWADSSMIVNGQKRDKRLDELEVRVDGLESHTEDRSIHVGQ